MAAGFLQPIYYMCHIQHIDSAVVMICGNHLFRPSYEVFTFNPVYKPLASHSGYGTLIMESS